METAIRLANSSDVDCIASLAEKIWRAHYTPIIGSKQVDYMLNKMYSKDSLIQQQEEGQVFYLACLNGQEIGFVSVSSTNTKDFFIHKFYLEIEQQRRGYGKKYFAKLIALYPELTTIRLQVNRLNYKTINFYFRLGFVIEEAKDFDIGAGFLMEDFVMLYQSSKKQ